MLQDRSAKRVLLATPMTKRPRSNQGPGPILASRKSNCQKLLKMWGIFSPTMAAVTTPLTGVKLMKS